MAFITILIAIACLLILYFCLGMALRFLWGWWICLVAIPACLAVGLLYGWSGAIAALFGLCAAVVANNEWHDTRLYCAVASKLDGLFNLGDV